MYEQQLGQLIAMACRALQYGLVADSGQGAAGARAKAALQRSKGDLMGAAVSRVQA
jgi:hypothetical protein